MFWCLTANNIHPNLWRSTFHNIIMNILWLHFGRLYVCVCVCFSCTSGVDGVRDELADLSGNEGLSVQVYSVSKRQQFLSILRYLMLWYVIWWLHRTLYRVSVEGLARNVRVLPLPCQLFIVNARYCSPYHSLRCTMLAYLAVSIQDSYEIWWHTVVLRRFLQQSKIVR